MEAQGAKRSLPVVVATGVAVLAGALGAAVLFWRAPTAMEVCAKLDAVGVASRCAPEDPHGQSANDEARFDLTGPGSHGIVEVYATEADYREALERNAKIDVLFAEHGQEPHRFQNDGARVCVMLVHGASERAQQRAERVVAGL